MSTFVHAVPLSQKKFTEQDRLTSINYFNPDVWPGFYDEKLTGMKYLGRQIMEVSDIEFDTADLAESNPDIKSLAQNFFVTQNSAIRPEGVGINADDLRADINTCGYELSHKPIDIALCPNGKNLSLDGRTRLDYLIRNGFTNVLVDYYNCPDWETFYKQGLKRNPRDKPRSPMTKAAVVSNCNHAIKNGWLVREYDEIAKYVEELVEDNFQPDVKTKIIHNVAFGVGHTAAVLSLSKESATAWLTRNGYHNNENGNGIYYEVYAGSAWSKAVALAAGVVKKYEDEGKKVKELRVIIHTGSIDGANPIDSWMDTIDRFRIGWAEDLNAIEKYHFNNPSRLNKIKLYGAIPAVSLLASQYPMDKLVMFHVGRLKDEYFSDIRLSGNLDKELIND